MFFKSKVKQNSYIKIDNIVERVLEKWNSIGNDFLITEDDLKEEEIIHLCSRNFGIGADQLVKIKGNKIQFFNADGTESGMCGNALKCIASREAILNPDLKELNLELKNFHVTIEIEQDQTPCIFLPLPLSFREEGNPFLHLQIPEFKGKKERFDFAKLLKSTSNHFFFVDIGNPHLVSIIDISEASSILEDFFSSKQITEIISYTGERIQKDFLKTGGVNLSFVIVENHNNIFVRTHERGVGETLSCGSGSAVSAFIAAYLGLTQRQNIRVFNKGSEKVLAINESYHQVSVEPSNLLLKGRGTRVAKVII